jgi:hypothetical protein
METFTTEDRVNVREQLDYFSESLLESSICMFYIRKSHDLIKDIGLRVNSYRKKTKLELLYQLLSILHKRDGLRLSGRQWA